MSLFDIDWSIVARDLTPSFKRSVSYLGYVSSLLQPLQDKSTENIVFDNTIRKRARFNSQIATLRAALNNIFAITSAPFIEIITAQPLDKFVFNAVENSTKFVYNSAENETQYVYNQGETNVTGFDFVIRIPSTIYTPELERRVRAETNILKLTGKTFNITQYTP